jgi:hypothetical protein
MATPHVSGVVALILAEHPNWNAAQVRHALQSTATDKGTTGRDDEYGWGLLDACNSVNSTLPTATSYSDAVHTTASDNFTGYGTEDTAFMYYTGLLPSQSYGVSYYDGGNDKRATDNVTSDASGNLSSQHTFVPETDAAGTWHVIVYDQAHTPQSTYSSNWTYTIGEDTFAVVYPPTMEAIAEAEGQYYNTAPVLSNFGFDDNEALDDGWYQMDSFAGAWTALFTDVFDTDVDDLAVASDNTTIYAAQGTSTLYVSTNSGVHWDAKTVFEEWPGTLNADFVAVAPDDSQYIACADQSTGNVTISDDSGTTWSTLGQVDATITIQDLDISAEIGGNRFVAVVGDDGTDAKVYYYEIGAIGAKWELISDEVGFASDQDEAGAVAFSPNFASDEVMVSVTANLSDAINFQAFSFNTLTWNDDVGGFSGYPLTIASDDGIVIKVLNPQIPHLTATKSDIDNNGVVLHISMDDISFLLTTDIMWEAEFELIVQRADLPNTVLKVAHGGSDTSTTPEFLAVVDPQIAVISVGEDNPYGHPSDEVVDRLKQKLGSESIYRTDRQGTIEFITDGERLWVEVRENH